MKTFKAIFVGAIVAAVIALATSHILPKVLATEVVSVDTNMTEENVQQYIHEMTHQKVVADQKWGATEITPENIENLLTIVKANEDVYEHSTMYINILESWKAGDFTNVVGAHNSIWHLQGGNVGRATGYATPEEEKEFIEINF